MALLTLDNVSFSYDGKCVCENVFVSIERGDYLCVVGENGSGKSTLMKGMLGLKRPQSGNITMGIPQNSIGYLPQQTQLQRDFPASIEEIVRSGLIASAGMRPYYTRQEKRRAQENMERLGIYDMRKKCYRELSGGQQQRVLLARALCATKDLILLDEPVTGLDPVATALLYEQIDEVNREGIAVIMVSHDINEAVAHASTILHMNRTPRFYGTKDAYVQSDLGKLYLQGGNVS